MDRFAMKQAQVGSHHTQDFITAPITSIPTFHFARVMQKHQVLPNPFNFSKL